MNLLFSTVAIVTCKLLAAGENKKQMTTEDEMCHADSNLESVGRLMQFAA